MTYGGSHSHVLVMYRHKECIRTLLNPQCGICALISHACLVDSNILIGAAKIRGSVTARPWIALTMRLSPIIVTSSVRRVVLERRNFSVAFFLNLG